jgi:lipopolysaccharide transport system ATP-binding protein
MKSVVIVDSVSKKYRISKGEPYHALRDVISEVVKKFFRFGKSKENEDEQYIWALKDVSFEVKEGEVVGIIGRNGAGKTTLLKILSKITYPTKGYAVVRGSVGAMLEVGIGFHPELTGRENIFLYGTILGMKRKEIEKKFDQIVEFSELADFIDTPVKYYSSGMYVRLAFATAAHLSADILLVDEVLAVGDVGFQKRCFRKMGEVSSEEGRTILVVSHNMDAILKFCQRAILIDKGKIIKDGDVSEVVNEYLKSFAEIPQKREWDFDSAPGDEFVKLKSIKVKNKYGEESSLFDSTEPIFVEVEYWVLKQTDLITSVVLENQKGISIFSTSEAFYPERLYKILSPGLYRSICEIPSNLLNEETYNIRVAVASRMENRSRPWWYHVDIQNAVSFQVNVPFGPHSSRGDLPGGNMGVIWPKLKWETFLVKENREVEKIF